MINKKIYYEFFNLKVSIQLSNKKIIATTEARLMKTKFELVVVFEVGVGVTGAGVVQTPPVTCCPVGQAGVNV